MLFTVGSHACAHDFTVCEIITNCTFTRIYKQKWQEFHNETLSKINAADKEILISKEKQCLFFDVTVCHVKVS